MTTIYQFFVHAHSGWRWIVLFLLLAAIVRTNIGWKSNKEFTDKDRKLVMFSMITFHLQVLVGIILYFLSPKVQYINEMMGNSVLRFFTIEHFLMMLLSMALITVGYSKSKKATDSKSKFKYAAIFFTVALIIMLAAIPWPFLRPELGGQYF